MHNSEIVDVTKLDITFSPLNGSGYKKWMNRRCLNGIWERKEEFQDELYLLMRFFFRIFFIVLYCAMPYSQRP